MEDSGGNAEGCGFWKEKEHKNPGEEERGGARHKVLDFSWGRR